MYDWELMQYLNERRYAISRNEYMYICNTCPQIRCVKYDAFKGEFEIWTDDRNYFRFKIYRE